MNLGIIGNGGREHSLCFKLLKSSKVNKIFCIPGNAGTNEIAENVDIDVLDFENIYDFVKKNNIQILIVGPEAPLVHGIVDFFEDKNVKIFGPNLKASQLEGSKLFMKNICKKFNIPTANFEEVKTLVDAEKFLNSSKFPVVVKSDGLAAGKGVTICENKDQALKDIKEIIKGKFKSSKKVFLEEFLEGEEASFFVITDGVNFKSIGTAQDHKRIGEGDKGLNTGGMGAYSPSYLINPYIEKKIIDKIIKPTISGMNKIGCPYKGILYAGIIVKNNEPKLIEYNIRFGDPECQVLMMRLKNDLFDLIESTFDGSLKNKNIKWTKEPCITVVAASKGYPKEFEKNMEIKNVKDLKLNDKVQLFHAATFLDEKGLMRNNGGRVFSSTVMDSSLKIARKKALETLDLIDWKNKYYRKDIAFRIIDK